MGKPINIKLESYDGTTEEDIKYNSTNLFGDPNTDIELNPLNFNKKGGEFISNQIGQGLGQLTGLEDSISGLFNSDGLGGNQNNIGRFRFPSKINQHFAWVKLSISQRSVQGAISSSGFVRAGKKLTDSIYLYMPQSVKFGDKLNFENWNVPAQLKFINSTIDAMKNIGQTSKSALNAVKMKAQSIASKEDLGSMARSVFEETTNMNPNSYHVGVGARAAGAVESLTGIKKEDLQSYASVKTGKALNPNSQMLFTGPEFRDLSLTWTFIPESQEESDQIHNIIKTIRASSYPTAVNGNSGYFIFPKIFTIEFILLGGRDNLAKNPKMIRFADCYCTGVSVEYNGQTNAFYADGTPSSITLSLNFTETEAKDSNAINKGF